MTTTSPLPRRAPEQKAFGGASRVAAGLFVVLALLPACGDSKKKSTPRPGSDATVAPSNQPGPASQPDALEWYKRHKLDDFAMTPEWRDRCRVEASKEQPPTEYPIAEVCP